MLQYDFENSLGFWICSTARTYERELQRQLAPHGITYAQCQVLAWLVLAGDLSQVELAERMNVEPPTIVRILDRMERDGLLERRACPGDRRKNLIRALPAAVNQWNTIRNVAERLRTRAAAGMTTAESLTLKKLLLAIRRNLDQDSVAEDKPAAAARSASRKRAKSMRARKSRNL